MVQREGAKWEKLFKQKRGRKIEGRRRQVLAGSLWSQGTSPRGEPRRALEDPRGGPWAPRGPMTLLDLLTFGPERPLGGKGGEETILNRELAEDLTGPGPLAQQTFVG